MNIIYKTALLLLLPIGVTAQPLTLEQCREMAIESSHTLKSAQLQLDQSHDMLHAYRTNKLPKISLSGGYLYSTANLTKSIEGGYLPTFSPDFTTGGLKPNVIGLAPDGSPIFSSYAYMPDMTFDLEVGSVFTAGVQLAQPIYMGGKINTAAKLAQVGVDVAAIEQSRSMIEVITEVDKAFFTYLNLEDMVVTANAYREVVDELERQVKSMLQQGMCTNNDLMRVEVKINEAQLGQLKATNGLRLARMNLCYAIGLPITTQELEVVDNFGDSHSIDQSLDITSRPEYALLAKSIEAKTLELRLAKSDLQPSISALANYNYTNGIKLNNEKLASKPSLTAGIMVDIPLFNWGERGDKVSAARREVEIAKETQADLLQKLSLDLMNSINNYNEASAQVALTTRSLDQTAENLRQSTQRYTTGMETLSTLLEAQAMWHKAMGDLAQAKANQRLAYTQYCRSRGILPTM